MPVMQLTLMEWLEKLIVAGLSPLFNSRRIKYSCSKPPGIEFQRIHNCPKEE